MANKKGAYGFPYTPKNAELPSCYHTNPDKLSENVKTEVCIFIKFRLRKYVIKFVW